MGGPRDKVQVDLTDPQSRIMLVTGKGFDQCYNAPAAADTESMLVASSTLRKRRMTNNKSCHCSALPASLGKVAHLLADTVYFSADNVKGYGQHDIELLIARKRDVHHLPLFEHCAAELEAPDSGDPFGQMTYRLKTQAG